MGFITIVFVCMIINCCFGVVFYINMCIAHAKIFIYFTTENHFKPAVFFSTPRLPLKPERFTGLTGRKLIELSFLVWNLNLAGWFTATGPRRFQPTCREKKPCLVELERTRLKGGVARNWKPNRPTIYYELGKKENRAHEGTGEVRETRRGRCARRRGGLVGYRILIQYPGYHIELIYIYRKILFYTCL